MRLRCVSVVFYVGLGCAGVEKDVKIGADAAKAAVCVLEHPPATPAKIAVDCGAEEEKLVVDILAAAGRS